MIIRLIENRIPDHENVQNDRVRSAYGKAASMVGIGANVLLFAGKLAAGLLSGSVAIMADAVNNLSDASSSIISLVGFKLADRPADAEHPYGHGRYEYLSGLMVAVMIMVIGVELLQSSVQKIIHPEAVSFSLLTVAILLASIAVKLWMMHFNRTIGQKIHSQTLEATADDSRNDVISTAAVLLSTVVGHWSGLKLDGPMGALVALFILWSGFGLVRDTIAPLLGSAPSAEQVAHIRQKVMSYPGVLGVHDLIVHDYGPGRQFASVHAEMSAKDDPLVSHDVIDRIERDFLNEEKLHLVVHFDPLVTDDPRIPKLYELIGSIAQEIDPRMTIHDLRIVPGPTHVNVVFDCIVPYGCKTGEEAIKRTISEQVAQKYPNYYCVITPEHSYVGDGGVRA